MYTVVFMEAQAAARFGTSDVTVANVTPESRVTALCDITSSAVRERRHALKAAIAGYADSLSR
jgi:hypothetical protein